MAPVSSTAILEKDLDGDGSTSKRDQRQGGRGRDRRGGSGQDRETVVSKALSKILRHDAEKVGLKLDPAGYINVQSLLQCSRIKSIHVTFQELQAIVATNAKQRFTIKLDSKYAIPDGIANNTSIPSTNPTKTTEPIDFSLDTDPAHYLIRANQGHSLALDSAAHLVPISSTASNVPSTVVHGTYFATWPLILSSGGLKRMGRNHIHFAAGVPEQKNEAEGTSAVISGMRGDAQVLIYVDIEKSLAKGTKWWLSDNGVILTEGDPETGLVGTDYWLKVTARGRKEDLGTLWEGGEVKAELPEWAKKTKAPMGKGRHAGAGDGKRNKAGKNGEKEGKGRKGGFKRVEEEPADAEISGDKPEIST